MTSFMKCPPDYWRSGQTDQVGSSLHERWDDEQSGQLNISGVNIILHWAPKVQVSTEFIFFVLEHNV